MTNETTNKKLDLLLKMMKEHQATTDEQFIKLFQIIKPNERMVKC